MIERTILKEKCSLNQLQEILAHHPDWEGVVSNYPIAWHVRLDKGGESLDKEVAQAEAYPDPRSSYLAEVSSALDAKSGQVKVKRGKHELSVHDDLNVAAKKKVGDKAMVGFLEGDRSKPIIVA